MTIAQKDTIQGLLRKLEWDRRTITLQYRLVGVPDSLQGSSVDSWLDSLSIEGASQVIKRLSELSY